MPLLSKVVHYAPIALGLCIVIAISSVWWVARPTLKQIERHVAAGEKQITPEKQQWILATYTTQDLAVEGFRAAYLEQDPSGWYKPSTKLTGGFVLVFRDLLHTREEWAAAYCATTACLDLWSMKAYDRTFEELSSDEAACVMQMSIGQHLFSKCDAALRM